MSRRALVATVVGWMFWSGLVIGFGLAQDGLWPADTPWLRLAWPLLAVTAFTAVARWKTSATGGRAAAEKLKRYGAMWQCLYGASWMMALGYTVEAIWLAVFALAGFGAMTAIKELMGLSGQPIAFRG